jgi:hypothetical protein
LKQFPAVRFNFLWAFARAVAHKKIFTAIGAKGY